MEYHVHQEEANEGRIEINIARYKKTVSSALRVQTIFLLSYLPIGLTVAVVVITGLVTPGISLPRGVRNIFSRSVKVRQAAEDTIRGRIEDLGVRGSITFRKFPIREKNCLFGRGNFSFFQVLVFNIA